MTLLVDIGNSRLKWAHSRRRSIEPGGSIARGGDDLSAQLDEAWGELPAPRRVFVCSVAGDDIDRQLAGWVQAHWQVPIAFVVSGRRACGVVNAYQEPGHLGPDRWAALVAARLSGEGPVCIIDCGTAVTVDLLAEDGRHLGGLIAPGLQLAQRSLTTGTGRIDIGSEPKADGRVSVFARSTRDAVAGGALYQLVAFVDRVYADLHAQYGEALRCLITGGDAAAVIPLLGRAFDHRPQLVFEGMAELVRARCSQRVVTEA